MTGQLQHVKPADARCVVCGVMAVGPCARCHDPLCGDCCVMTEGGSQVFAICPSCARRGGRSLRGGWGQVLGWVVGPMLLLAAVLLLLRWLLG